MMNSKSCLPLALFFLFLVLSPSYAHNQNPDVPPDVKQHSNQAGSLSGSYKGSIHQGGSLSGSYKGSFSKVYAFGDSYTDTGNAYWLDGFANFAGAIQKSLYGSTFGKEPNRLCDGRLVIDFLCESLALPHLPAYKNSSSSFEHGVNFAIAGSTSLPTDFFTKVTSQIWKGIPLGLQTQIDWFEKFTVEAEADLQNSLFWIGGMGLSDYSRASGSPFSLDSLRQKSVFHVGKLLQTVLEKGAKYIVVQGLPPVGCLPLDISLCPLRMRDGLGCSSIINGAIQIHNQILQKLLENLRQKFPNCNIIYADYWNAYLTVLKEPAKFGFAEPFKACCGTGGGPLNFAANMLCGAAGTSSCDDPTKHMIWDGIHLTEAMHKNLADLLFNQGFCKPSFADLIKSKGGT